jgi:transcriptional regulator with XRE-family HTH domain
MKKIVSLSSSLRSRRRALGLSLKQVARRAGTSVPTLSRYETGWARFELKTLRKLATALGCRLQLTLEPDPITDSRDRAGTAAARIRRLFWDAPFNESNMERHPRWVITRVLEFGDLEDLRALLRWYGTHRFLELVSTARFSSRRPRVFWRSILDLEGIPCTNASSRPAADPSSPN